MNLVLGHGVHISEEKNWILLTRKKKEKKLDPTHQEKKKKLDPTHEEKDKKTGSYSPGERGPGAGPSGVGAIIISQYFCNWSI